VYAFDKAVKTEGLFLLFMLRLCPLVPFSVLNFCVGFTSLTWFNFTFSLLGIIPSTIIYVYIGTGISDIRDAIGKKNLYSNNLVLWTAIIGSLLGLAGIIWTSYVANNYLNEILASA
jgi:uncharacterized membrane protein YdjX (TVP38/TMEM64 family)